MKIVGSNKEKMIVYSVFFIVAMLAWLSGLRLGQADGRANTTQFISRWEHTIPSPMELQRYLGVTDDGVIGKNTMDAWLGYIYQAKADPYFDPNTYIERQADVWQ